MRKKISILELEKMKQENRPVAWVTAYNYPFARAAELAGVDMILVGDSGGMVELGYKTTNPVTMDEMIILSQAVRRGAPNTFVIGDMPQGSYEISDEDAVANALRFVKEAGCDAVKLEGGERVYSRVKAIADAGILVMGHLGLTPQSAATFGGYRIQCKTLDSFNHTLRNAEALVNAGVFSILLEAMPAEPAGQIARRAGVPVYGIGAGNKVHGQLLIMYDLLGLYPDFCPRFAKNYMKELLQEERESLGAETGLLQLVEMVIARYVEQVRKNLFPSDEFIYPISEEELNELRKSPLWRK